MNVSLTPELEKFISAKVQSGRYNSASEVGREALRLWEDPDEARAAHLAEFSGEVGGFWVRQCSRSGEHLGKSLVPATQAQLTGSCGSLF